MLCNLLDSHAYKFSSKITIMHFVNSRNTFQHAINDKHFKKTTLHKFWKSTEYITLTLLLKICFSQTFWSALHICTFI